ncbi:MAG: hypothetical protein QNL65_02460, partial [Opitutales bacterium]
PERLQFACLAQLKTIPLTPLSLRSPIQKVQKTLGRQLEMFPNCCGCKKRFFLYSIIWFALTLISPLLWLLYISTIPNRLFI